MRILDHTHLDTFTRYKFPERVVSPSQRPLPTQHRTNTRDDHPCIQWDSNPRFQQPNWFRLTPQISWPLISAQFLIRTTYTALKIRQLWILELTWKFLLTNFSEGTELTDWQLAVSNSLVRGCSTKEIHWLMGVLRNYNAKTVANADGNIGQESREGRCRTKSWGQIVLRIKTAANAPQTIIYREQQS
jgi:hypothetical protein